MTRRRTCPTCGLLHYDTFNSVELQLGGRMIAYMRHVCPDCVAKLVVNHGFQCRKDEHAEDIVLNLPIAGMHALANALIRVGSRARGDLN